MQTQEQQGQQEHKHALLVQHDDERRCMKWMIKMLLLVVAKDKDSSEIEKSSTHEFELAGHNID